MDCGCSSRKKNTSLQAHAHAPIRCSSGRWVFLFTAGGRRWISMEIEIAINPVCMRVAPWNDDVLRRNCERAAKELRICALFGGTIHDTHTSRTIVIAGNESNHQCANECEKQRTRNKPYAMYVCVCIKWRFSHILCQQNEKWIYDWNKLPYLHMNMQANEADEEPQEFAWIAEMPYHDGPSVKYFFRRRNTWSVRWNEIWENSPKCVNFRMGEKWRTGKFLSKYSIESHSSISYVSWHSFVFYAVTSYPVSHLRYPVENAINSPPSPNN